MEKNMNKQGSCTSDGCSINTETGDKSWGEKKHISGIVCNVSNCVHHDCETHCTAKEIAVGPSFATTSQDTICATFRQKD